jgi:flagellar hook-associated protein 2
MIKELMKIQQLKVERQLKSGKLLEWKNELYSGATADLRDFRNNFISVMGTDSLAKESAFNAYSIKVTGTGSNAVTLTPSVYASASNIQINSITQLAKGASVEGVGISKNATQGLSTQTKLKDLQLANALEFSGGRITFEINGKSFSFSENQTLGEMINTVNNSDAGVTMAYTQIGDKFTIESKEKGAASTLTVKNLSGNAFGEVDNDGNLTLGAFGIRQAAAVTSIPVYGSNNVALTKEHFSAKLSEFRIPVGAGGEMDLFEGASPIKFKINGKEFEFDGNDTLQTMMDKINSESDAKITFNEASSSFTITPNGSKDGKFTIENVSGHIFGNNSALGITGVDLVSSYSAGQNAKLTVNGVEIERDSNNFTLDGVGYTLNRKTETGEEIFATVAKDVQPAIDKIKKFVEGYNTLIKKLEDLISTRKTTAERKYVPLTEEERSVLSEDQIKQWEDIAKKGLLYGDTGIQRMLTNLRGALVQTVESAGLSPSAIGIKTGNYFEGTKGQIVLDEDKLRAALERDPEQVMKVFQADGTTSGTQGLLGRIDSIMSSYSTGKVVDGTYRMGAGELALSNLKAQMKASADRVTALQEKMAAAEEKYYLKFAAMEAALSKMNEQSNWLASLTGTAS